MHGWWTPPPPVGRIIRASVRFTFHNAFFESINAPGQTSRPVCPPLHRGASCGAAEFATVPLPSSRKRSCDRERRKGRDTERPSIYGYRMIRRHVVPGTSPLNSTRTWGRYHSRENREYGSTSREDITKKTIQEILPPPPITLSPSQSIYLRARAIKSLLYVIPYALSIDRTRWPLRKRVFIYIYVTVPENIRATVIRVSD